MHESIRLGLAKRSEAPVQSVERVHGVLRDPVGIGMAIVPRDGRMTVHVGHRRGDPDGPVRSGIARERGPAARDGKATDEAERSDEDNDPTGYHDGSHWTEQVMPPHGAGKQVCQHPIGTNRVVAKIAITNQRTMSITPQQTLAWSGDTRKWEHQFVTGPFLKSICPTVLNSSKPRTQVLCFVDGSNDGSMTVLGVMVTPPGSHGDTPRGGVVTLPTLVGGVMVTPLTRIVKMLDRPSRGVTLSSPKSISALISL